MERIQGHATNVQLFMQTNLLQNGNFFVVSAQDFFGNIAESLRKYVFWRV
jgi:phage portal protein BeeE